MNEPDQSEPKQSEPEKSLQDFLQRWSRRKLAVAERGGEAAEAAEPPRAGVEESASAKLAAAADPQSASTVAAFDPASLPPIESINAASDVRPFLAPGVPVELARAALRRAWASDPVIRDFVGLAENQWDFTSPDGVPGFGSLELGADLRRIVAALSNGMADDTGSPEAKSANAAAAADNPGTTSPLPTLHSSPDDSGARPEATKALTLPQSRADAAENQSDFTGDGPNPGARRKQGAALPK